MAKRFEGKVVVITGGSSGIGLTTALRCGQEGAKLVLSGRSQDKLDKAVASVKEQTGADVVGISADVSTAAGTEGLVQDCLKHFGKIDAVNLNAGMAKDCKVCDFDEATFDKLFNTNCKSVAFGLKYFINAMKEGGIKGNVLVTSSVSGQQARSKLAGDSLLASSKAAVDMLAKYAAIESADAGIRVNVLAPGNVSTPAYDGRGMSDDDIEAFAKECQLMPRTGEPAEVSNLAAFLMSDEASFITGSVHLADGGWLIK